MENASENSMKMYEVCSTKVWLSKDAQGILDIVPKLHASTPYPFKNKEDAERWRDFLNRNHEPGWYVHETDSI